MESRERTLLPALVAGILFVTGLIGTAVVIGTSGTMLGMVVGALLFGVIYAAAVALA